MNIQICSQILSNGPQLKFQVDGFQWWGDMLEIYFIFEYTSNIFRIYLEYLEYWYIPILTSSDKKWNSNSEVLVSYR